MATNSRFLACSSPQILISYIRWPVDSIQTASEDSLEIMESCFCHSLCFRTIEEYSCNVGLEYPQPARFLDVSSDRTGG